MQNIDSIKLFLFKKDKSSQVFLINISNLKTLYCCYNQLKNLQFIKDKKLILEASYIVDSSRIGLS